MSMKPGLKRIEATLDQLEVPPEVPPAPGRLANPVHADAATVVDGGQGPSPVVPSKSRTKSPAIEPFPLPKGTIEPIASETSPVLPSDPPQPVSAQDSPSIPILPRPQAPSFSSHRHAANPNLAVGLLQEIESLVRVWQVDLEETVQQIHALYQEGPIVEGWLESQSSGHITPPVDMSLLRHADVDYLMAFIEQLCQGGYPLSSEAARTDYRLCGLDPDGQVWSRPCPPDQVAYVSLAIARYQKLRTLLAKKENLENRLTGLVQTLTMVHGQIREG
ncbi:hypothetical protein [Egbenema bharatensis]|uniref:hypothetical protein n=1 Tax=Egbenema bharatensis TaxID=3463334 RepID=UPI003A875FCD